MSKTFMTCAATALALVLALPAGPARAQDTVTADTVVASVNGVDITMGNMLLARASLPEQYQQLPDSALFDGILTQLIQQEALAQAEGAVETRRVVLSLQNERRALMASEALAAFAESAVTDEALQAAYDAAYANADGGTEYNASHILVESEDDAKAVIEMLNGGADFAETAREKSTGPSGPNGGELGWFSDGMMVAPFQEAVAAMEAGTVSAPVQTQFGWHVIKLNETRVKAAPTLDEVRAELTDQIQRDAVTAYIEQLVAGASVVKPEIAGFDPSVMSNFSLLEE